MAAFLPILMNAGLSLVSIIVCYKISTHTINTNQRLNEENAKINAENAGKNRIIYEIERMESESARQMNLIKEKLETGNYTVLNSFSDPGNFSNVIVILGKIKP